MDGGLPARFLIAGDDFVDNIAHKDVEKGKFHIAENVHIAALEYLFLEPGFDAGPADDDQFLRKRIRERVC